MTVYKSWQRCPTTGLYRYVRYLRPSHAPPPPPHCREIHVVEGALFPSAVRARGRDPGPLDCYFLAAIWELVRPLATHEITPTYLHQCRNNPDR